jgi:hypothetical protein
MDLTLVHPVEVGFAIEAEAAVLAVFELNNVGAAALIPKRDAVKLRIIGRWSSLLDLASRRGRSLDLSYGRRSARKNRRCGGA